jgi:WbqC-like protein family
VIVSIHQPQYFPYLGFFHKLACSDVFVALDTVQFLRRGFQNRAQVKTQHGASWLTVPVEARQSTLIADVAISETEPWQRRHVSAIRTNYGRAPFFDRYAAELSELLASSPWRFLGELDLAAIRWVAAELGISTPIVLASDLGVEGARSDLLAGLCRAVGGTTYLSGSGGARYMDLDVFERAGVAVEWQAYASATYEQLFPQLGFVPDLSILDVLLCCGPDTKMLLEAA